MKKKLALLFSALVLVTPFLACAQEEDLGVGEQNILPGSPFYLLKEAGRSIQSFFTFNPVKKLELKQRFSSERLAEIEQMAGKGASKEALNKALQNYAKEEDGIRERVQNLNQENSQSPEARSFMEKYTHQKEVHNRILQKLEDQVPSEVYERIREQREKHLERFKDVMLKLEEEENIPQRMENFLQNASQGLESDQSIQILEQVKQRVQNQEVDDKLNEVQERLRQRVSPEQPTEDEEEQEAECEQRWWFDSANDVCQQKEFCGMYMYQGLQTFDTLEECQTALEARQGQQGPGR